LAGYSSSKTNESAILSSGKTSSASKDAKQETKGKCKSVPMDEGRTRTSRIANRDHLIGDGVGGTASVVKNVYAKVVASKKSLKKE
jgi:hypothetical protein